MNEGVAAEYFDGRSAAAHAVHVLRENDALRIAGSGVNRLVPLRDLQWPERTRHGPRVAHLKSGGSLQCADAAAWDALARACGRHDSAVVRAQRSWGWVIGSVVAMLVLVGALFQWGVPAAARVALVAVPLSVDQSIGDSALAQIDERLVEKSALPEAQRRQIAEAFAKAVAALPPGTAPAYRLEFRKGAKVGPNAFALPGGTMVLTDELVTLVKGDTEVVVGVLAHELGHIRHRHGMRMLIQASAIGVIASVIVGDFNSLLAAVPVMLGQASYSRDAEREADAESVRILRAAGISPAAMVRFFDAVNEFRATRERKDGEAASAPPAPRSSGDSWLGIAIASHPADEERVRFFREAAQR